MELYSLVTAVVTICWRTSSPSHCTSRLLRLMWALRSLTVTIMRSPFTTLPTESSPNISANVSMRHSVKCIRSTLISVEGRLLLGVEEHCARSTTVMTASANRSFMGLEFHSSRTMPGLSCTTVTLPKTRSAFLAPSTISTSPESWLRKKCSIWNEPE
uniref:Uncharacterized protein n=1 Tax=Ixodes ricinus TaxID=34613 RepID=A0A6B0UW55_IXORI